MLPKGSEIVARTKLTIEEITRFVREEFELPNFKVTYSLKGKSDRSWCRQNINGPYIQLGVQSLLCKPVRAFVEYKSFNNYLEVGGFKTDDWRLWNDAVIVHEMSHAVQFELLKKWSRMSTQDPNSVRRRTTGRRFDTSYYIPGLGWTETNHGTFFLAIYKRLRARFVNDRVPREAYTAPRNNFDTEQVLALSAHPLQGVEVIINRKRFTILGKDGTRRSQYAYKGKCALTGQVFGLKLIDIASTEAAKRIIESNSMLSAELAQGYAKRASRQQAAETRAMRRMMMGRW